jgi:hypothetical protein
LDIVRFVAAVATKIQPQKENIMGKASAKIATSPAPAGRTPMTQAAASRIQSATARVSGGHVPAGSFPARATSAAAINAQAGTGTEK